MKFNRVAIASYPRSGNTWVRHLLYSATGIGSRYNRNPETGIPHRAGGIHLLEDRSSPFIKTHDRDAKDYDAAIHITRHPCAAIASYLDYMDNFKVPMSNRKEFIEVEAQGWATHSEFWRMTRECGILSDYIRINYEDLIEVPFTILRRVVHDFLGLASHNDRILWAVEQNSLSKMRIKGGEGAEKFFVKGAERNPEETMSDEEIDMIMKITEEEREHLGYW